MSTISIRLPKSLHEATRELAKKDQISIDHFVTIALAEKISALMTEDYLKKRAKNAPSRKELEKIMAKVPDVEPEDYDKF